MSENWQDAERRDVDEIAYALAGEEYAEVVVAKARAAREWSIWRRGHLGSPDLERCEAAAEAIYKHFPHPEQWAKARCLDLVCPQQHRVAEVVRAPGGRMIIIVRWWQVNLRMAEKDGEAVRVVGPEEEHGLLADWLDESTSSYVEDGLFLFQCRRCHIDSRDSRLRLSMALEEVIAAASLGRRRRQVVPLAPL